MRPGELRDCNGEFVYHRQVAAYVICTSDGCPRAVCREFSAVRKVHVIYEARVYNLSLRNQSIFF